MKTKSVPSRKVPAAAEPAKLKKRPKRSLGEILAAHVSKAQTNGPRHLLASYKKHILPAVKSELVQVSKNGAHQQAFDIVWKSDSKCYELATPSDSRVLGSIDDESIGTLVVALRDPNQRASIVKCICACGGFEAVDADAIDANTTRITYTWLRAAERDSDEASSDDDYEGDE